jgi:predicted DNA binding CopG/RHH family protein
MDNDVKVLTERITIDPEICHGKPCIRGLRYPVGLQESICEVNNMESNKVDPEEESLLNSYERDEWQSIRQLEEEKQRYQEYARATFKKDSRVNIRISSKDLEAIQKKALEEGIPYQTLIASILHKCVSGRLVERT